MEMEGLKFAVLLCAEESEYMKKKYGGLHGIFVQMLKEEGETWDLFKVASDDFPADDKIADYDGFVITGSCSDAHGDDVWISELVVLLKKLDAMEKKVLGICFGHQIVGRTIGGRIGRASAGWDIGITKVHLQTSQICTTLKLPASISIIQCHKDEVLELPPKAEVLAWSNRTRIEMFRYGDHIMGIQGHPEYTKDILLHLIDHRLLKYNLIKESLVQDVRSEMEAREPDTEMWRKLCTIFLKGRF